MLEERYKDGSKFVTYAEDDYETKRSVQRNSLIPSIKDPTIWKVKCMVGRERLSAFCLMQKYVDLQSLGTKLQIISAFSVEHVKGFIYIEADKQCDINEGTWARMKNGKYKRDLAQIVVVSDAQKKATVKLIPRIDLQAMAEKFSGLFVALRIGSSDKGLGWDVGVSMFESYQGPKKREDRERKVGGVSAKKRNNPAPRLISSSELEEFRPLIQYRRDRDTGKLFEILDGQMLKDGYLYKKVSIDSLSCWGVTPSEEELHKFTPSSNEESVDLEWLSQLYGERKQKRTTKSDKGGEKGEGSSGSSMVNSFELHDLVCFGRKDFGIVIGMEKDENYKILKDGPEGPVVQTVVLHELKNPLFENKFTALDQHMKTISINDTLKVLEGPLKGRQGLVKKIYRGVVFYMMKMKRKIMVISALNLRCGGESGPSGFEDFTSSPKSPLSPKKPWQARENNRDFNRGDKDGMFSVGQTLRIRVGPLKGYLCRVLAIRYSDVTVKLDSQHKVLTVKCEHLSEVRGKGFSVSISDNPESSSLKSFGLLGTQDSARDWVDGAGTSAESDSIVGCSYGVERVLVVDGDVNQGFSGHADEGLQGGNLALLKKMLKRKGVKAQEEAEEVTERKAGTMFLVVNEVEDSLLEWVYGPLDRRAREVFWEELGACLLPRPVFGHFPVVLDSGGLRRGSSPFRLENMWLKEEGFKDLLKTWWNKEVFANVTVHKKFALNQVDFWDAEEGTGLCLWRSRMLGCRLRSIRSGEWRPRCDGVSIKALGGDDATMLEASFSEEEVLNALSALSGDKAQALMASLWLFGKEAEDIKDFRSISLVVSQAVDEMPWMESVEWIGHIANGCVSPVATVPTSGHCNTISRFGCEMEFYAFWMEINLWHGSLECPVSAFMQELLAKFPCLKLFASARTNSANPFGSVDNDSKKVNMGDASWEIKSTPNQKSSWGAATTSKTVADSDQVGGWGKSENSWNKSATTALGSSVADGWEKAKLSNVDQAGSSKATTSFGSSATDNWGKAKLSSSGQAGSSKGAGGNWDNKIVADGDQVGGWGKSENCWNRSLLQLALAAVHLIAGRNQKYMIVIRQAL
ncbi:Protein RNA-directed DNA methylation 3 [Vitis vinifera]|uniref:Protein RNA-directed DNA methylation 3 n=1 Tax=Vitis vinifera TaxID=29760 RepID=A0A438ILS7_VITVI|nr:Protein RNA-directed DNA methylation 3 [Vitis vinifera]